MLVPTTHLEKKTMICPSQGKPFRKPPFGHVRTLSVHNILYSEDAQCNTEESPQYSLLYNIEI